MRTARAAAAWKTARQNDVLVRSDGAGWFVDNYGRDIARTLQGRLRVGVLTSPTRLPGGKVIHRADGGCFFNARWIESSESAHRVIGTWWHGGPESIAPDLREATARIERVARGLARVHVTCRISRDVVRAAGVPEEKIALLPFGIDETRFYPPTPAQREAARRRLGIPERAKVVGLFQKDGEGWQEGSEPKLIKGPDIFVAVVTKLAVRHDIFALVPGPARGFVVRGLFAAGIAHRNDGHVPFEQLVHYYHACDVYIVTGREEGGPAAVLESFATATPLVAHRVGMAADLVDDGHNGFLAEVGDVDTLVAQASLVLDDRSVREHLQVRGLETARAWSWPRLADRYEMLYRSVLSDGRP